MVRCIKSEGAHNILPERYIQYDKEGDLTTINSKVFPHT